LKKTIVIIAVLTILVIGYVAVGPFITFHQIRNAIDQQDLEKLSENVDFPTLRQNLKEQLNAVVMKETVSDMRDNPFGGLALALLPRLIDSIVDSYVTPSGLASFMEGRVPNEHANQEVESSRAESASGKQGPFHKARYSYDSISKFSVWLAGDNGGQIRLVLTRDILNWKLTNIVAPIPLPRLHEHDDIVANQASAVGSLRTLNTAEITYSSAYNVGFSYNMAYLAPPATAGANPTSTAAGLIDSVLASGSKNGYSFTYSPGASDSTGRINTYAITALPISSSTGTNYYYTDESGVIRQNATRPATSTDTPIAG
jgi:hypothetical protein